MEFQANAESLPFFLAAGVSVALLLVAWSRRPVPTLPLFALMMAGETLWALCEGLELVIVDLPVKQALFALRATGVVTTVQALLLFVLRFTGRTRWLSGIPLALMVVPHVALLTMAWTNPWHHLYWAALTNQIIGGYVIAEPTYGAGFRLHLIYCYAQSGMATALILRAVVQSKGFLRQQAAVMLFGVACPWAVNAIDLSQVIGRTHLDTAAMTFTLTGLMFLYAMRPYRIAHLIPAARETALARFEDPVIAVDDHGLVIEMNAAAERLSGGPSGRAPTAGRRLADVFESWPAFQDFLRGASKAGGVPAELPGPPSAPRRLFSAKVYPIRGVGGRVIILRDVTYRGRIDAERTRRRAEEAARARAEAANRAKDDILATLSHELRTPLTPALAALGELIDDPTTPDEIRETLAVVSRGIVLEARMIDDLLDMTRIVRGKLRVLPSVVDAHAVVREALSVCAGDLGAAGLRVEVDLQASAPYVRGDAARLLQVVWNLLKNAAKFTPEGGRVDLRSRNRAASAPGVTYWELEVTDTGIGIAPDFLPRIFDAFSQAKADGGRRTGGLGLGLSICRALIEAHGGRLAVSSPGPGLGSTFTIRLVSVATPVERPTLPGSRRPAVGESPAAGGAGVQVLLVEDDPDTRWVLGRLLRRCGYEVRTAGDIRSALELADSEGFDVLITDIGLPDGSGHQLLRSLQARSPRPFVAIALSGFGMDEDVRRSEAEGFAEHLTKPIDSQSLLEAIRSAAVGVVRD